MDVIKKRVLITDGNQRSALAATRSLGRRGIYTIIGDEKDHNLSASSKYAKESFVYPSPSDNPKDFIEALKQEATKRGVDLILPMTDVNTALLLRNRDYFSGISIPFADYHLYEMLSDKWKLFHMATDLGIVIPKTWFIEHESDVNHIKGDLTYPLVIKPHRSRILHNGRWISTSVRYADSEDQLVEIINGNKVFSEYPFLLQERIIGTGQGIFALYDRGTPLVFFAHRRLREKPPSGGVSVLCESIPVDPVMREIAQRLFDSVKWHGVAMVEFKVDREGKPYLMEVNARFWGSLQLAIDAGVDFPYLLYLLAIGERFEPVQQYKVGIKSRWFLGDIDHLYLQLLKREESEAHTLNKKMQCIKDFLHLFDRNTRYEINRWDDMRPFFLELRKYILH